MSSRGSSAEQAVVQAAQLYDDTSNLGRLARKVDVILNTHGARGLDVDPVQCKGALMAFASASMLNAFSPRRLVSALKERGLDVDVRSELMMKNYSKKLAIDARLVDYLVSRGNTIVHTEKDVLPHLLRVWSAAQMKGRKYTFRRLVRAAEAIAQGKKQLSQILLAKFIDDIYKRLAHICASLCNEVLAEEGRPSVLSAQENVLGGEDGKGRAKLKKEPATVLRKVRAQSTSIEKAQENQHSAEVRYCRIAPSRCATNT